MPPTFADRPDPDRPADRHHDTGDLFDCGVTRERRPQRWQEGHVDARHERERDGQHRRRQPDADAQRGGTATYIGGSGTNTLTFSYTVAAGQNTPDLTVTAVNLNGATISDGAGNAANLSLTGLTQGSPQIDTTPPTVSSVVESPSSGDLNAGKTVTLTLSHERERDGQYGRRHPDTDAQRWRHRHLYQRLGHQCADLQLHGRRLGRTPQPWRRRRSISTAPQLQDGAGNAANLSLTGLTQSGPQIDTTAPAISSIAESPSSGDLNAGKTVTYTINMSENVTVNTAGGTPTLTLNDGGTATYTSGSGTSALTFSYTVAAGQNTPDLMVTAVNLNGATISDGAGNAANLSLTGLTQGSPQIDTTDTDGLVDCGVARERRSQRRQDGHADAQHERERDGQHDRRQADADAQRWWHRHLCQRLGYQYADLQLHGGGRAEHRRPGGDGGQSQRCYDQRMAPAMPPTCR